MSSAVTLPADLSGLDSKALMRVESDIAQQYMGLVPWGAVAWGLCNLAVWLSLWPLAFLHILPLWIVFPVACLNVALCYLPSHEAQHDIIARPGQKLRWLNELVGQLSTIPLVLPYRVLKITHMEHHKHANDPLLDPDIRTKAENSWTFLRNSIANRQPRAMASDTYVATLARLGTPEAHRARNEAILAQLVFLGVLFASAWSGYAIEAALIWWLPRHVGQTYIGYWLSWAPHHPATETGRYRDTRGFRSAVGNLGSMGMQYHIIHHLHPRIPLMKTPAAYRALKPVLVARGCEVGEL
jgi:beta-carotene hydroxylase